MANRRWKDSIKLFRSSKSLEKDEHVKWITLNNSLSANHLQSLQNNWRLPNIPIEPKTVQLKELLPSSHPQFGSLWFAEPQRVRQMDNNIKNILKLANSMNHDNKEIILKKKCELIQLVEEFHKQYQSLPLFYSYSKEGGRQTVAEVDNPSSPSSIDSEESEIYYTPKTSIVNNGPSLFVKDYVALKAGPSLTEDTGLEVKAVSSSGWDETELISEVNLLRQELDEKENDMLYLSKARQVLEMETSEKIRELDRQVDMLKTQLEILNMQKEGLEDINLIKDNENSVLRDRISELELIIEEKGEELSVVLKNFNDSENRLKDSLNLQKRELEWLLYETGKGSDEILFLHQELEKKSKEMSEFLDLVDSLKKELERKTEEEQNMVEEMDSLRIQIQHLEKQVKALGEEKGMNNEVRQLILQNEKLYDKLFLLEEDLKEKEDELTIMQSKIENDNEDINSQQTQLEKIAMEEKNSLVINKISQENDTIQEREEDLHIIAKGKVLDMEEETLGSMQKVERLEKKVGQLENTIVKNEEEMQVLKERKREAIRQLCMWQDYHFNRYDLLRKAFSELRAKNQLRAT